MVKSKGLLLSCISLYFAKLFKNVTETNLNNNQKNCEIVVVFRRYVLGFSIKNTEN